MSFLVLISAAFHFRRHGSDPMPSEASQDVRAPASLPAPPPGLDPCKNLYRAICHKRGEIRDPTGVVKRDVVGELQALRIYEDTIRAHPDWNSDQVDEALVNEIYTEKRRARFIGAYKFVQNAIERFIDRQPESVFTHQERRILKSRIRKVQLQLPPPATLYADEPDIYTKSEVFYERLLDGTMRMRVGGAFLLTVKSWFNMVFTMAHELAHAIDPCETRMDHLSFPAYDRLTACLLHRNVIISRKNRSECGDNDQLSETFADWVAVEITAQALQKFSTEFDHAQLLNSAANSVRDLCEQDEGLNESEVSLHPAPEVRIERIFGSHPTVRQVLGCAAPEQPDQDYCGFDWTLPPGPAGGGAR